MNSPLDAKYGCACVIDVMQAKKNSYCKKTKEYTHVAF